jgi:hypothetical protein
MSHLPNLGALGLRLRVAKTGTNALPDPKRHKTSGAQDPDVAAREVEAFLTTRVAAHFGRAPTEQERRDLIERVRRDVAEMYADEGLTYAWPDAVGLTEGQALLDGKPADVRNRRELITALWGKGFIKLARGRALYDAGEDRKRKQAMSERERKDRDGDEGRDYFASMKPETPESPDAVLRDELRKKANGQDPQRWGENLHNSDGDNGCCRQP